jgi:hypothetical protein
MGAKPATVPAAIEDLAQRCFEAYPPDVEA